MNSSQLLKQAEALFPRKIDMSLGRLTHLLGRLGNPHHRLPPIIHVAGTNGKGSTCAMIRAMLQEMRLDVHAYQSPHLIRFHERIIIQGQEIAETELCCLLTQMLEANDNQPITFFESTTAAAFSAFTKTPADWLVLEVGLGGRLDATNLASGPGVSVITPIDIDHHEFLGHDIMGIAAEKFGIARKERPLIVGRQRPEVSQWIETKAKEMGIQHYIFGRDFDLQNQIYKDQYGSLDLGVLPLAGTFQYDNAAVALATIRLGTSLNLRHSTETLKKGLAQTKWPGRMQDITQAYNLSFQTNYETVTLDGGHNPHAGRAMAEFIKKKQGPIDLILALQPHKDAPGYLQSVGPLINNLIQIPCDEYHQINDMPHPWNSQRYNNLDLACQSLSQCKKARHLVISGSLYLVGHVLKRLAPVTPLVRLGSDALINPGTNLTLR